MKKHILSLLSFALLSTTALNAESFISRAKQRAYASFQENVAKVQRCIYESCTTQQKKEAALAATKLGGAAIAALGIGAAAAVGVGAGVRSGIHINPALKKNEIWHSTSSNPNEMIMQATSQASRKGFEFLFVGDFIEHPRGVKIIVTEAQPGKPYVISDVNNEEMKRYNVLKRYKQRSAIVSQLQTAARLPFTRKKSEGFIEVKDNNFDSEEE